MVIRFAVFLMFLLSSCVGLKPSSVPYFYTDCTENDLEMSRRYDLFPKLSVKEIARRQKITAHNLGPLSDFNVVSQIISAIDVVPKNTKLIPVDLRYYHDVHLGNIIISNMKDDWDLENFLSSAKFSQGFFTVINFGAKKITAIPPSHNPDQRNYFQKIEISRSDLVDAELVFNVSNAQDFHGNMKFTHKQHVSIIADNVKKPYRLDVREASNIQYYLGRKWIMSLYSIVGSHLDGGKDTGGFFKLVNNRDVRAIRLDKFSGSEVACYVDEKGQKL
jgi:hypothetical protein